MTVVLTRRKRLLKVKGFKLRGWKEVSMEAFRWNYTARLTHTFTSQRDQSSSRTRGLDFSESEVLSISTQIRYDVVKRQIPTIGPNGSSDQSYGACGPMFLQFPAQNLRLVPVYQIYAPLNSYFLLVSSTPSSASDVKSTWPLTASAVNAVVLFRGRTRFTSVDMQIVFAF